MTRRTMPILLILVLSLGFAAPAMGLDLYQSMVVDYIKNQRLDACKYTQDQLKKAKNATPVDQNEYSASFIAALDDAIAARAQGACNKSKAQGPAIASQTPPPSQTPPSSGTTSHAPATPGAPAQAQPPPTPTAEPSPAASIASDDSIALASDTTNATTDPPFPVLALAVLAGLLALAAMGFGFVRFFAWEPAWAVRFRHAAGEAGWRASSTFSEFADFVRLGR